MSFFFVLAFPFCSPLTEMGSFQSGARNVLDIAGRFTFGSLVS